MKCPECNQERDVLIACGACPLVCCYQCAVALPDCRRLGDRWPVEPPKTGKRPMGEVGLGRQAALNWRNPENGSTNVSPAGHLWGPA